MNNSAAVLHKRSFRCYTFVRLAQSVTLSYKQMLQNLLSHSNQLYNLLFACLPLKYLDTNAFRRNKMVNVSYFRQNKKKLRICTIKRYRGKGYLFCMFHVHARDERLKIIYKYFLGGFHR